MKVRELKDKEVEIVSIEDMDKSEEKDMKKIRPIKNTWYNWLINYVPEPIRTSVDGFGDKFISLFKINTSKQTGCGRGRKQHKWKTQKQSEEKIFNSTGNLFELKKDEIIIIIIE